MSGESDGRDALRDELDALPRSVEPPRDLWPGIRRGIERRRVVRGRFARRAGVLAAAAAVLAGAVLAGGLLRPRGAPERAAAPPAGERAPLLLPADVEHAAAAREVLDRLDADLDPETVAVIRRNLDIIDEAVAEIRRALDEEPHNARLNHLLAAEERRRSAVIRQAADLTDMI
jgi:hypothetical protein